MGELRRNIYDLSLPLSLSPYLFLKGTRKRDDRSARLVGCHKMASGCEGLTGRVIRTIKVAQSVIEGFRWGRQPVASLLLGENVHGSFGARVYI